MYFRAWFYIYKEACNILMEDITKLIIQTQAPILNKSVFTIPFAEHNLKAIPFLDG